jgi:hypothetical protein
MLNTFVEMSTGCCKVDVHCSYSFLMRSAVHCFFGINLAHFHCVDSTVGDSHVANFSSSIINRSLSAWFHIMISPIQAFSQSKVIERNKEKKERKLSLTSVSASEIVIGDVADELMPPCQRVHAMIVTVYMAAGTLTGVAWQCLLTSQPPRPFGHSASV